MISVLTRLILTAIILMVAACSTNKPLPEPYYKVPVDKTSAQQNEMSWWAYRFRIRWSEENDKPDFSIDLLLADAVVKPVLERNAEKLLWWRFHRRAARQAPGHQFSFLFYTDDATAADVLKALNESPLLANLIASDLIVEVVSSDTDKKNNTKIEAFSDKSWSAAIQKTWPSYIMGVSAFWLALIDEVKSELKIAKPTAAEGEDSIKALLQDYRRVDDEINEMWQQEGQHALLHHLSAVMGYKPVLIKY